MTILVNTENQLPGINSVEERIEGFLVHARHVYVYVYVNIHMFSYVLKFQYTETNEDFNGKLPSK